MNSILVYRTTQELVLKRSELEQATGYRVRINA